MSTFGQRSISSFLLSLSACFLLSFAPRALGLASGESFTAFLDTTRRDFLAAATTAAATSSSTLMSSLSGVEKQEVFRKPKNAIRWGIVGLGDVTEKKSGPPFWKCDNSLLVAVMRRTPGKAAAWVQEKVPRQVIQDDNGSVESEIQCTGYDNLEDFLRHDGLDAVYVSTRPGTHLEITKAAAAAGKAVYVEKPVGRCADETLAMEEVAKANNVPFYTAYISRAYERTETVRRLLLKENVIGDHVTSVTYKLVGQGGARDMTSESIPWRLDAKQSGGGLLMDVGCHVIDRIDYMLNGPLVGICNQVVEKRDKKSLSLVEDFVHFEATIGPSRSSSFTKTEGAKVSCTWDFTGSTGDKECDVMTITGPKGYIQLTAMSPSLPVYVYDSSGNLIQEYMFETPEHTAQNLIQGVTNELLELKSASGSSEDGPSFISRGNNAVRTSKVIDQVLKPYYGDRTIGYWDNPQSWQSNN